ncbi:DUF742 domain-containing protein [Streptomyces sp. NPDC058284]|uniref:DUF742 domain-containing protein n=1 Tax=unclassified Streptomyces TaxID=2593676 RepID=UPI00364ED605
MPITDPALGDVRPYVLTQGRTRPRHALDLISRLIPGEADPLPFMPSAEHSALVDLCRDSAFSVSELSARLGLPVQVTKVLLGDLIDSGALRLLNPAGPTDPEAHLMEKLLDGLRYRL